MNENVIFLNAFIRIPLYGKKKRRRLKGHVPNAKFLAHVLVCLCQNQSFRVGKHSKRQEISSANKTPNISNLHPRLVSGHFCGHRSTVEKYQ